MEKMIFLFLFFVLCSIGSHSQSIYSEHNLEQASREELNAYLKVSQKLKKTGATISIAGPATILAGIVVVSATWDEDALIGITTGSKIGGLMIVAGMGATLVGVPTLITGSSRVKRITRIMNKQNGVSIELAPCRFQDYLNLDYQMGATMKIKF